MNVSIICVGKIKEKFYRDALEEYAKRLSRYCKFSVVEVADEPTPDNASEAVMNAIKQKEASRILAKIPDSCYVCTLEIVGKRFDSVAFSEWMQKAVVEGKGSLVFVIGGSLGLDASVCKRADFHLSFSDFTFPHQLMRVILAEQIYRGFRIANKEPYHK